MHEPLDGIYDASEGWFVKLIDVNEQFTTGDPEKAHLFYIYTIQFKIVAVNSLCT
jgi:hypothetical protein